MANGTGVADAGVSYTSVEEVENSSYAVSNVFAAKKYGQRWRKKAALNQRKSPRESNDGPETHGQANQSRVPAPQESNDGPKTHGQALKQSRVPAPNQKSTDLRLFVQRPRPNRGRFLDLNKGEAGS